MANGKHFESWLYRNQQLSFLTNFWVCYKLGPNSEDFHFSIRKFYIRFKVSFFSNSRCSFSTFYLFFEEKCLQCCLGPIFAKPAYEGNHSYSRLWQNSRCLEYKTGTPLKWKVNESCIPKKWKDWRSFIAASISVRMPLLSNVLARGWWTRLLPALSRATDSLRLWVSLPWHQTRTLTLKELLGKESTS